MSNNLEFRQLLKPEEAAAFLRCSTRTLARWRAEGVGPPYHQRGARILYGVASLLSWLEETTKTPVRSGARGPDRLDMFDGPAMRTRAPSVSEVVRPHRRAVGE